MATDPELDKKNPNFDAIRHFKGTWKNFEEFWKEKGARMSPWEEWDEEYPEKKKRINKNPIQMYKTFDDESDVNESKVEQSAGFAIIYGSKVLLGHATGKGWWRSYSIPKGHLEKGETILKAALRETKEEIGISIPKNLIPSKYQTCAYIKAKKNRFPKGADIGTHWKDVHYYIIQIESLDEIGLETEVVPKSQLQLKEIDWAGFVPIQEALKRISPVMKPIIESLMIYNNNAFKTFEQFKESLDEENILALGGSQQDSPPMSKPFVLKTKKKRAGGNDDDEEDETEEVANVNTVGIGTK